MIVSDAVDVVVSVHGEGHTVQALVTHGTPEAAWVVGLAQGLQDLGAGGTEQSVQVGGSAQPPKSLWAKAPGKSATGERAQQRGSRSQAGSHHLHDEVSTHATLVSCLLEPRVLWGGQRRLKVMGQSRPVAYATLPLGLRCQ